MKPKTVKSFLKLCLTIANANRYDLKGIDRLTKDEYFQLGIIRSSIQNDLGEMSDLLEKHSLKYDGNHIE